MLNETDEELVEEVQEGSILAFEVLVKRYQNKLFYFTLKIVGDEAAAEEVVQDTFLNTYKSIDKIDVSRKFSSFIYSVAKNTSISYLRKIRRFERMGDLEHSLATNENIYNDVIAKEEKNNVQKAIGNLNFKYKSVVKMYYLEDLSYRQIGEKLDLSLNTVKTRIKRGKEQLRKALEK
ncbi:RNA polymerase sigma factor [Candidatus Woesebacteria bacterium]|nr:RNA polymerase sigma factor [Candidatus Woesebacteria bacterium]